MPQTKADEFNPLLSTPVAMIAGQIAAGLAQGAIADTRNFASKIGKELVDRAELSVTMAELVVTALQERGHLPRTTETEEPKADDATLILQGVMLGLVRWVPYGEGDPRGELYIGSGPTEWLHRTKLVKGVPPLNDETRTVLTGRLADLLRKL